MAQPKESIQMNPTSHNVDLPIDVNVDTVRSAARMAAFTLTQERAALVVIEPGDMTRYEILISRPSSTITWFVSSPNLGWRCNAWHPSNSNWTPAHYCDRWTDNPHSQQVLSAFLNLLREAWEA